MASAIKFDTAQLAKDFTPTGVKLEGPYENDRNSVYAELYKAILREVYNVKDIICGHHLIYVRVDKRIDNKTGQEFDFQVVEEIPSADTLIFDHSIARVIWGEGYRQTLARLALEPTETRDVLLAQLYYGRHT